MSDDAAVRFFDENEAATSLQDRIANGVCPCCHRSFVQLARHMKTKHPDFEGAEFS